MYTIHNESKMIYLWITKHPKYKTRRHYCSFLKQWHENKWSEPSRCITHAQIKNTRKQYEVDSQLLLTLNKAKRMRVLVRGKGTRPKFKICGRLAVMSKTWQAMGRSGRIHVFWYDNLSRVIKKETPTRLHCGWVSTMQWHPAVIKI